MSDTISDAKPTVSK